MLRYATLFLIGQSINPGAADLSLAASRSKVLIPGRRAVPWRHYRDFSSHNALFRQTRLLSVCDSITGKDCPPLDESRLQDLLWDHRGLQDDTLYDYRFRKILLTTQPKCLVLANQTKIPFVVSPPYTKIRLKLKEDQAPAVVPLDWKYLVRSMSSQQLSRLLMAVEFDNQPPVVPPGPPYEREDYWVPISEQIFKPIKKRRKYALPSSSTEAKVLNKSQKQTAAFDYWDRHYFTPGELVKQCASDRGNRNTMVCPESENPDNLHLALLGRSYSPGQSDHMSSASSSSILGKVVGPLPPSISATMNLALERTAGSLKQSLSRSMLLKDKLHDSSTPVFGRESLVIAPVPFIHQGNQSRTKEKFVPLGLRTFVGDDSSILSKLNRDHRTWPYLAVGLGLQPELIRKWVYGGELELQPLPQFKVRTIKQPVAIIAWAVKLPQVLMRTFTLGLLHLAKMYVDVLAKWYGELPAIQQFRDQVNQAIQLNAFRKKNPHSDGAKPGLGRNASNTLSEGGPAKSAGALSGKRLELLSLYESLLATEVSPVKSAHWIGMDWRWTYPEPLDDWLPSHFDVGLPPSHVMSLKGSWHIKGLTSLEGEVHIEPHAVVSNIAFEFEARPSRASSEDVLNVYGYKVQNITSGEGELYNCIHKHRRGQSCPNLVTTWHYRVRPTDKTCSLVDDGELIAGTVYSHVDVIHLKWDRPSLPNNATLQPYMSSRRHATGFVNQWSVGSAPYFAKIKALDMHMARKAFTFNNDILVQIVNETKSSMPHVDPNIITLSTINEAIKHSDLYLSSPKHHSSVLLLEPKRKSSTGIAFTEETIREAVSTNTSTVTQEESWNPKQRFDHFRTYWGTIPLHVRQMMKSIGLDRAGVVPRGFQLPLSAQTAYDASILRAASRALHESRGRPFLTKDGTVVSSDMRIPDVFEVEVRISSNLPVEAPVIDSLRMREHYLFSDFLFNEFAQAQLSDQPKKLDDKAKELLLSSLRNRLEVKMSDLGDALGKSSEKPVGSAAGVLKGTESTLSYDSGYEAVASHDADSASARGLAEQHQKSGNVIDALRRMNVDQELNNIVAETLGEIEMSVMDLIKDVTIIAITEDPETGETISRKVQLELNPKRTDSKSEENGQKLIEEIVPQKKETRSIAFEISAIDDQGNEKWIEIFVPVDLMKDKEALTAYIQDHFDFDAAESARMAQEVITLVEGYDLEQFDALFQVLDEYNLDDADLMF